MTIKTLLTAAALVAAPVLAPTLALACPAHDQAKMSCADGMTYDSASHSCKVISG